MEKEQENEEDEDEEWGQTTAETEDVTFIVISGRLSRDGACEPRRLINSKNFTPGKYQILRSNSKALE